MFTSLQENQSNKLLFGNIDCQHFDLFKKNPDVALMQLKFVSQI